MKLLFKILAVILVLLLALVFILPIIFKGEIIELAKTEINKNVKAKVDFADMNLSLIKNFPNFSLSIEGLSVIGMDEFENDTLASVDAINVTIGLFSVIKGDQYEIKKIVIESPAVNIKVLQSGQANYEIAMEDVDKPVVEDKSQTDDNQINLQLKHFRISNASIHYTDEQSATSMHINNLNNQLSGDFSADKTNLNTKTDVEKLSVNIGGIDYLSNASLNYRASIQADLKNEIYTLGKNELKLSELLLEFNGSVSMLDEGINMVLTFNAPSNKFKNLLSLIPAVYTQDFKDVKADGNLSVDGMIKGIYNEDKLPAFNLNLKVENGMFGYPDLPQSVTEININSNISSKGGEADNTVINVSDVSMMLGENPFKATMLVKTPVSDPDIDAKVEGKIDLASVKDFYPVEDDNLNGSFLIDVKVKGKLSAIEQERYNEFVALGSVLVQNLKYTGSSFNKPVEISNAQMNFSPKYLDLSSFNMQVGKSDLKANGKVTNYLAYVFKNGELKGNLTTSSRYFNLDELTGEETGKEQGEESKPAESPDNETGESSVIEIPERIDFTMKSNFDKLIYDGIEMDEVKGQVRMRNETLTLNNLQVNVVEGIMTVNGSYSTKNPKNPLVDLNFGLKGMDIPTAYNKFAVVRTYLPIAKKTSGTMLANFNVKTSLDEKMMPIYETMNGGGRLSTSKITINDLNTFLLIAEALKFTELQNLNLDALNVNFKFINGKMSIEPFDINYNNINANIEGWTGFDQSIGYVMNMNIPRKELGNSANQLMDNLAKEANKLGGNVSLPETISFDILIGGTLSKPTVKTGLAESGNDFVEQAKEQIIKEISKEAMARAQQILDEADKQAKSIIAEAEKQAKYLRENADDAVSQLKTETAKQADSLVAIGKKNGFVAELAAKEAARQLNNEANNQGEKLLNEADVQSEKLISEAKNIAKGIQQEAQKQADALLKK